MQIFASMQRLTVSCSTCGSGGVVRRARLGRMRQRRRCTCGLGAPYDVRTLQQSLADAHQQIVELRRQLEECTDELAAARAANRELMTQLNTA